MQGLLRISQEDDGSVHLSSLNLTIALSFFGIMWSIVYYTLFTKWQCFDNESLWNTQLLPFLKSQVFPVIKERLLLPCIKACCPQARKLKSLMSKPVDDSECKSLYSVNGVHEYQSIDGDDKEKLLDDDSGSVVLTITKKDESEEVSDENEKSTPLFGSSSVIILFTLVQLIARPFIIAANIVYLALNNKDYFGENTTAFLGLNRLIYGAIAQETTMLILGPAINAIYWACCWRQCHGNNKCRRYLEFLRFSDLQIAVLMAPYGNIHLYALGGWWYLVLIVRLVFYAVTFAAAVIAGMRFICACYCHVFCACGCDNDVLEIRNVKHLLVEIGLQLIPIFLKINTCSSAFATFIKLAPLGGPRFRQTYYAFSLIRGFTSLWSLGFSGAMLRWSVLKREHKWDDRSWLTKVLRFLNKYRPHVHISFFFDMLTYFGLLVLNLILLELITERDFYCNYDCSQ